MVEERNWEAVGAVAACVVAGVALATWASPRASSPPEEPPATNPPADDYGDEPDTRAPRVTSPPSSRSDTPVTVVGLAGGCEEAIAAAQRYVDTAGDSRTSQAAAAAQAYSDMMGASLDAEPGVHSVTVTLSRDFLDLKYILEGALDQDYSAALDRTIDDIEALLDLCDPG